MLPRIPFEEGFHRLVIRMEQIGLKDASVYMNAFFTVSVKGDRDLLFIYKPFSSCGIPYCEVNSSCFRQFTIGSESAIAKRACGMGTEAPNS